MDRNRIWSGGHKEGVVVDISVGNFAKWCSLEVMWIIKAIGTDKMTKEFMEIKKRRGQNIKL